MVHDARKVPSEHTHMTPGATVRLRTEDVDKGRTLAPEEKEEVRTPRVVDRHVVATETRPLRQLRQVLMSPKRDTLYRNAVTPSSAPEHNSCQALGTSVLLMDLVRPLSDDAQDLRAPDLGGSVMVLLRTADVFGHDEIS